jgi:predicted nucleic acid-binding protein
VPAKYGQFSKFPGRDWVLLRLEPEAGIDVWVRIRTSAGFGWPFSLTAIRQARLEVFLRSLLALRFDAAAAIAYGQIIAQCGWSRRRDFHLMIAAHAISTNSVLVTNNTADFSNIPGLSTENWVV